MNNSTHSGIIETAKKDTIAVARGTENIVEKTVDGVAHIVINTVKDTAKVGGAVETAATGLVTGAVVGVEKMAVTTEHAAGAVAGGAVKAVGQVTTTTVDAVRQTVTKPVSTDKAEQKAPAMVKSSN